MRSTFGDARRPAKFERAVENVSAVGIGPRDRIRVNGVTREGLTLKYNKHYIGLARDGVADNFLAFRARKEYLLAEFRIPRSENVTAAIEEADLDVLPYNSRWDRYRLRLRRSDIQEHQGLLTRLVALACGAADSGDSPDHTA